MYSHSIDFKEQQSIEEQLEWMKAAILAIHDGVLVIDKDEIVRLINPEYTRITGVTPEEILGRRLRDVRPNAMLVETLRDRKERVGIYRKEGNTEYVVDMAPIIIRDEVIGAVSVCKGLTEVHRLTRELQKNRKRLTQLKNKIGSIYQPKYHFEKIIGAEKGLKEIVHIGRKAAKTDLPVLIMGESGTGKELFAQSIHHDSSRANEPFVPVNCAAIPSELLESELFGYEEGTFTNAKKGGKMGLFEIANKGTIFLDEIGELNYNLQAKLLRVLQEQTIRRLGGVKERYIDVRVIAATNKNLRQLIEKNLFREDLFYRLNVFNMYIPPLRERKEDIPDIVHFVLANKNEYRKDEEKYKVNRKTWKYLLHHHWTGNVRELKNVIEYAICMTDSNEILPTHLPPDILHSLSHRTSSSSIMTSTRTLKEMTEEVERQYIQEKLSSYGDSLEERKKVALSLGISLATLYNKMKKYNLE